MSSLKPTLLTWTLTLLLMISLAAVVSVRPALAGPPGDETTTPSQAEDTEQTASELIAGALDLVLEEITHQLEAEVLEGQGRAVEELEHEGVVGQLGERSAHRVAEIPVTLVDEIDEVIRFVIVIEEGEKIRVEITRGPVTLSADNDDRFLHLATGDALTIGKAQDEARVLGIDTLRCTECRYAHAPRRRY